MIFREKAKKTDHAFLERAYLDPEGHAKHLERKREDRRRFNERHPGRTCELMQQWRKKTPRRKALFYALVEPGQVGRNFGSCK
jgi:hypothetical protein